MISTAIVKQASALTLALYEAPGAPPVQWAKRADDPICWAVVKFDDLWYLIFRGSKTRNDWEHDFEALPIYVDEIKAHLHSGFNQGIRDILMAALVLTSGEPFVICGHSLGAARAAIASAYAIATGRPPIARVAWGEPRPGFADLARVLAQIPNYNFVNGDKTDYDRVTDVPFTLPLAWYCAGAPHLFVSESPLDNNPLMMFRYHNFLLYNAAMNKLPEGEM